MPNNCHRCNRCGSRYNRSTQPTGFRETAEQAVRDGKISAQERREIVEAYEAGLRGYTYFER